MGKGLYLPSAKPDSKLLVSSLRALLDLYPSVNFTSLNYDEKLHGYRIYFSEPDETVVLAKNYLSVGNRRVWIYPLTTVLTVLGVPRDMNSSFKKELKDSIIDKFGNVLEVEEIDEDWRIQIDIPEFRGLEPLHQESFQDMTVSLPKWNQKFEVVVWCRRCKKSGHFQQDCDCIENGKDEDSKQTETQPAQSVSRSSSGEPVAAAGEFSKFTQKSINSIAERIGREEVLNSGIISDGNLKSEKNESASSVPGTVNHIPADKEIKKENGVDDDTDEESKFTIKCSSSAPNEDSGKNVIPKEEPRMDEDSMTSFAETVSNDDDVVIEFSGKPSPVNASSHDSNTIGKEEAYNSEDASRSPTNSRRNFSTPSFLETQPFTPSPSRPTYRTPKQPQSRVEDSSVLSVRLQECINNACETCKVLDRRTLDAFLTHVKKKSNPERVALNFTKDSNGLKAQLEKILHLYYNTPQTGTKEDMQFIKWLNGLVGRFGGTIPRKRKRNEHSSDEGPSKK